MAKASPSGPKAKRTSGRPMLPVLGKVSAGRKSRGSSRSARSAAQAASPMTRKATRLASAIWAKAPGSGRTWSKVATSRLGVPMYITNWVTKALSKARPMRAQA